MDGGYNLLGRIAIFAALLASVVVHEVSHGAMADAQGDATARLAGRLTLNPLKHLDPVGTIFMLLIVFAGLPFIGWAKPVPINPAYFRDYRKGIILTSLAGPFANLSLMIVGMFVVLLFFQSGVPFHSMWVGFFALFILINYVLMIFNLIPIPPLDGSHVVSVFLPWRAMASYRSMAQVGILILVFLVVFDSRLHILSGVFNAGFRVLQLLTASLFGQTYAVYMLKSAFAMLGA